MNDFIVSRFSSVPMWFYGFQDSPHLSHCSHILHATILQFAITRIRRSFCIFWSRSQKKWQKKHQGEFSGNLVINLIFKSTLWCVKCLWWNASGLCKTAHKCLHSLFCHLWNKPHNFFQFWLTLLIDECKQKPLVFTLLPSTWSSCSVSGVTIAISLQEPW